MVEWLTEKGLFRGRKGNPGMQLAIGIRSGDVIEPMLKPQWWVDTKDMAAKAMAAVKDKDSEGNSKLTIKPSV